VSTIVLLGPQRLHPTLVQAVEAVGAEGSIAAVTAGWEEREDEIDELREHLGRRVVNLQVHARTEDVFRRDGVLLAAWQERRAQFREMTELHRARLTPVMQALRALRDRKGREDLLAPERAAAMEDLRRLDAHRVERVAAIQADFERRWRPHERPSVAGHRAELTAIAGECGALAVAGGNVAVLLNRMRLFGVVELFAGRTVFAWSAGAMAMTEQVVLFHDDPPWGRGDPLVLGPGFGLCPGIVALPHAHRRIRLDKPARLRLWHERFAPRDCLAFDDSSWLVLRDGRPVTTAGGVRRFSREGNLVEFMAA
jgi:hypothetical protein